MTTKPRLAHCVASVIDAMRIDAVPWMKTTTGYGPCVVSTGRPE